jgi:hypothetical protein
MSGVLYRVIPPFASVGGGVPVDSVASMPEVEVGWIRPAA